MALSIGVQAMVRADLGGSGVMFSIDTESGFPGVVVISAAWGLGEPIVQGAVDPDRYLVFKPPLGDPRRVPILEKTLGGKARKMVYASGGTARTALVDTTRREREAFVLQDAEILQLARWAVAVEQHYGRPMDLEWAHGRRDGRAVHRPGAAGDGAWHAARRGAAQLAPAGEGQADPDAAPRSARRSPAARSASSATPRISRAFPKAPCWSPRRPIPTGCR